MLKKTVYLFKILDRLEELTDNLIGPPGPQGIQGERGRPGKSEYLQT
jgi:hypothetical protein